MNFYECCDLTKKVYLLPTPLKIPDNLCSKTTLLLLDNLQRTTEVNQCCRVSDRLLFSGLPVCQCPCVLCKSRNCSKPMSREKEKYKELVHNSTSFYFILYPPIFLPFLPSTFYLLNGLVYHIQKILNFLDVHYQRGCMQNFF